MIKLLSTDHIDYILILGSGNNFLQFPGKILKQYTFKELGFCKRKLEGHKDLVQLIEYKNHIILACYGRFHFYEGEATRAKRMKFFEFLDGLNAKAILQFCASGLLSNNLRKKGIYPIETVVNLRGPFVGVKTFPTIRKGYTYFTGHIGPTYGTPSESFFQATYSGDMVGMSITNEMMSIRTPQYIYCIVTDCAQGITDKDGSTTEEHSHELVVESFKKQIQLIPEEFQTFLETFP